MEMTQEEQHKARHRMLHGYLDELLTDFLRHNPPTKTASTTTVMELAAWSHQQTIEPVGDYEGTACMRNPLQDV